MDFFEARDLIGLRTLRPLNNVELNLIALFEALVALALDGAVVNEDVGPTIPAEESVALCVVEPLYRALILCQWNRSLVLRVWGDHKPGSVSTSTVATLTQETVTQKLEREFSGKCGHPSSFCQAVSFWLLACNSLQPSVENVTDKYLDRASNVS
jgi:hypothetical protein